MGKFENKTFDITGTFGDISVYKMRGIDRPVARTKGGPSKEKVSKSPSFAITRMNNQEFGEAAIAAASIRLALLHVRHLRDYNFTPKLNGLCREIMKSDDLHPLGSRQVFFSTHRHLLDGFSLNKANIFDSVIRHPLTCTIDRKSCSATVNIPPLSPGFNLFLPWTISVYRIVAGMGKLEDKHGYEGKKHRMGKDPVYAPPVYTPWLLNTLPQEDFTLTMHAKKTEKLPASATLVVSVGIEMGMPDANGEIVPAKHMGCAKILMTG